MSVTAPYAIAVFDGRNVTSRPPKTEIWCMLYAQVLQADAPASIATSCWPRRQLDLRRRCEDLDVARVPGEAARHGRARLQQPDRSTSTRPPTGRSRGRRTEIRQLLELFHLAVDTPLSVLAVEMMPRYDQYIILGEGA